MEALSDGIVDEGEISDYYKVIEDERIKMSKIIKDLLQLSQLESDTMKFKMEKFEFTGYLSNILSRYKHIAAQRKIDFNYQVNTQEDLFIYGDELRMEQGITNLLSNAFKHSDNYVYVDLSEIKGKIILSIENSGEIIDQDDLNHIFESFYKGKNSLKKEGTGLGLSIASRIFVKHNFDLRAYNKNHAVIFELILNNRD
jgi:signal transduction histidine kinase